ncbi:hypothetical protein E1258_07935 [Micromonospora sp. KC207]|uniref:DUF6232 family protein n=1 Tax=Micromonospora sp. KC207 TaxID=2530377 RepID=UPI00104FA673|nr:DUF6232 family protein [Micromonospora sp. KC207]TDC64557.1 hypothetical protein E1258_07935 [Micromonospora sp. KC207]
MTREGTATRNGTATGEDSSTRPRRSPRVTPAAPVLLYAQPGIVVTADRFTVGRTTWEIADLTHLHAARGPHDRLATRAVAVTSLMITGMGLLLGFTGGLQRLTAGAYLAFGAVALLPVLLAVAGERWRPPPYELWGWHRGAQVLLFSSDDERQFGQVSRAVRRAREGVRHGGWGPAPAAAEQPFWHPDR